MDRAASRPVRRSAARRFPQRIEALLSLAIVIVALAAIVVIQLHGQAPTHHDVTVQAVVPQASVAPNPAVAPVPADGRLTITTVVDDASTATDQTRFTYRGSWQHLRGFRDGRSNGTSSRSFEAGAVASLRFIGDRFVLMGVRGPTGGIARLSIDGVDAGQINFYARLKRASDVVYSSGELASGSHSVAIKVVAPDRFGSRLRYVNIDGATTTR